MDLKGYQDATGKAEHQLLDVLVWRVAVYGTDVKPAEITKSRERVTENGLERSIFKDPIAVDNGQGVEVARVADNLHNILHKRKWPIPLSVEHARWPRDIEEGQGPEKEP